MEYSLAKKLKDAGFPQKGDGMWFCEMDSPAGGSSYDLRSTPLPGFALNEGYDTSYQPTLLELLNECGEDFHELKRVTKYASIGSDWYAVSTTQGIYSGIFTDPSEALASLWLALKENPNPK